MHVVALGVVVLAAGMLWCLARVRAEFRQTGQLRAATVTIVWLVYALHFAVTVYAAWKRPWPLDVRLPVSNVAGASLVIVGAVLYLGGIGAFGSFKRKSGLDSSRLVTTGIYAWSRNPQNVGWALFLLGFGVAARSGVALLLAGLFWLAFRSYLPLEEEVLRQRFGSEYEKYCKRVRRYFGPAKRKELGKAS